MFERIPCENEMDIVNSNNMHIKGFIEYNKTICVSIEHRQILRRHIN